jgi:hypothetical protein
VRTGTSGPSVGNEEFVMMDVSGTGMKGVRETETCDRDYFGNVRKCGKNNMLLYFNSQMVDKIVVR